MQIGPGGSCSMKGRTFWYHGLGGKMLNWSLFLRIPWHCTNRSTLCFARDMPVHKLKNSQLPFCCWQLSPSNAEMFYPQKPDLYELVWLSKRQWDHYHGKIPLHRKHGTCHFHKIQGDVTERFGSLSTQNKRIYCTFHRELRKGLMAGWLKLGQAEGNQSNCCVCLNWPVGWQLTMLNKEDQKDTSRDFHSYPPPPHSTPLR